MKPFRYSGNKSAMVKHYRGPLAETKRIVEPYLGSGAYSLSFDLPCLGYELNADVVAMWKWLQTTTESELRELAAEVEALKFNEPSEKPDVRLLKLSLGQQTYVRVNITGVYTGQLSCWAIYPQHKLPIENTIRCLPRIKNIEVVHASASAYEHQDGDLLFVDPPYAGTKANYIEKSSSLGLERGYSTKETIDVVQKTSNPVIFTYGDGAESTFPDFSWQRVLTRKVPNIRKGGTVDRSEWVAYINW